MESNKILGADILDIVFDGRNKEYGAYELRKTYNRRLGRAMAVMSSVVLLLFLSGFVGKHREKKMVQLAGPDVVIGPPPPIDPPPPPPPPPPKPPMPQVRMIADVTPRIVPDDKADAPPPPNEELENAKIGTVSTPGGVDNEIVAPPVNDAGKEVTERPKATEEDNRFIPIEKESEFPGGAGAWMRFLNKNLRTPDYAINNEITGTVVVRFVVDGDGNDSDVVAI